MLPVKNCKRLPWYTMNVTCFKTAKTEGSTFRFDLTTKRLTQLQINKGAFVARRYKNNVITSALCYSSMDRL